MSSLLAPGSEKEGISYFSEDHADLRDNHSLQGEKRCFLRITFIHRFKKILTFSKCSCETANKSITTICFLPH